MVVANIVGMDGIWVLIIAVVVLFGGSQLPKLARNVGLAGREFRKAHDDAEAANADKDKADSSAPREVTSGSGRGGSGSAEAADDKVTLSRSELESLLDERDARAKRETNN